ncbi:hypothetical protein [Nocardia sp. NPDC056100]|uniref:hypothetical protein n=1 Tax=Nocardia sp. NPDC056100 TaxID=3345712 RepID=UPI0035DA5529
MNELLTRQAVYSGSGDLVSIVELYDNARQLYPLDEAFDEAVAVLKWVVSSGLMEVGTVGQDGAWKPIVGSLEEALTEVATAYREDPRPAGEGRWMYMFWLQNTKAGNLAAGRLTDAEVEQFDIFY